MTTTRRWAAATAIAIAAGGCTKHHGSVAEKTAEVLRDEAALQRTVASGTAAEFVAAAQKLQIDARALAGRMDEGSGAGHYAGETDVHWMIGALDTVDAQSVANPRVRMYIGAKLHDRLFALHPEPLPYTVEPKVAAVIAREQAAASAPIGSADDGMRTVGTDVDRLCACTDDKCFTAAGEAFEADAERYADLLSAERGEAFTALTSRGRDCVEQLAAKLRPR